MQENCLLLYRNLINKIRKPVGIYQGIFNVHVLVLSNFSAYMCYDSVPIT